MVFLALYRLMAPDHSVCFSVSPYKCDNGYCCLVAVKISSFMLIVMSLVSTILLGRWCPVVSHFCVDLEVCGLLVYVLQKWSFLHHWPDLVSYRRAGRRAGPSARWRWCETRSAGSRWGRSRRSTTSRVPSRRARRPPRRTARTPAAATVPSASPTRRWRPPTSTHPPHLKFSDMPGSVKSRDQRLAAFNSSTEFEVSNLSHSRNISKKGHVALTTPIWGHGVIQSLITSYGLSMLKIWRRLLLVVLEISLGPLKFKMRHVTNCRPCKWDFSGSKYMPNLKSLALGAFLGYCWGYWNLEWVTWPWPANRRRRWRPGPRWWPYACSAAPEPRRRARR